MRAVADPVLDQLLAGVSRSFYLSLSILPAPVRPQIAATYLVARAADTIADTRIIRSQRRAELLSKLAGAIAGPGTTTSFLAELGRALPALDGAIPPAGKTQASEQALHAHKIPPRMLLRIIGQERPVATA